MAYDEQALNELSRRLGILESFTDPVTGIVYWADKKSKQVICDSLGYKTKTNTDLASSLRRLEQEQWGTIVPPTITAHPNEIQPLIFEMTLPLNDAGNRILFTIEYENNTTCEGAFNFCDMPLIEEKVVSGINWQKRRVYLFINADMGYHRMVFRIKPEQNVVSHLIIAPQSCYMPPFTERRERVFGFPMQLYAMRSDTNWGIGDFTDLKNFIPLADGLGASLIGVNPLNVLYADTPEDASPYCASSRLFLNPLYADLDVVPEAQTSQEFQNLKSGLDFQKALNSARENPMVQYGIVADLKYKSFKVLHKEFIVTNFDKNKKPISERGKKFIAFCDEHGSQLINFATFQLLRQHFLSQHKTAIWWEWEAPYRDINSDVVRQFQSEHMDEIDLMRYQQFVVFEQYDQVVQVFRKSQMPLGLYTDLPVGVGENSAEVWSNQSVFMERVTTGAPSDVFNKKGQDWSLAPFNPIELAKTGFAAYRRVIMSIMRGAGAVRLDHAFGLERLYLRVKGATGAYLRYPYKALIGIVALESHRHNCLVIAEDLGTPPDGFYDKMATARALSFKISHYQKYGNVMIPPSDYGYMSLVATGTHDLPSYTGFWKGLDLELARGMKIITATQYQSHKVNRSADRQTFTDAFYRYDLPMPDKNKLRLSSRRVPEWFISNMYRFLSMTNSMVLLVRFEDLLGQDEQINLPGTCMEYPNWRYKLPYTIDTMCVNQTVREVCGFIAKERTVGKTSKE